MIKLNVGCGPDIKPIDKGWVNIDGNFNEGVDLVLDLAKQPLPFPPNTVDHILAQNIIEHVSRHQQKQFIQQLHDRLKVGGTITIEMPNLKCIAERYLNIRTDGKDDLSTEQAAGFLFGAQEDDFGCHRWIYDFGSLEKLLTEVGFVVYYMDEIRGTNLICKAIKHREDSNKLEDAFFDCAISAPFYVVTPGLNKEMLIIIVRLAEFGRVFCYGGWEECGNEDIIPEFEHENIIKILEQSLNPLIYKSKGVVGYQPHSSSVHLAKQVGIKALAFKEAGMDIDEAIEWITQKD